jgi:hypothetical protein
MTQLDIMPTPSYLDRAKLCRIEKKIVSAYEDLISSRLDDPCAVMSSEEYIDLRLAVMELLRKFETLLEEKE